MTTRALKADAKNRAARTLLQGLAIDVLIAVGTALAMWLPDATLTAGESWLVLGVSVGKTALTVLASWLMRLKIAVCALPAPLPPADPGEPDDDTA